MQVTVPNEVVTYELGFVNITCEAEGTNADVEFTWTLSGDPDFQEDGPELYMEMIMTYQAGFYTCEARTVEAFPETATGTTEIIVWCKSPFEILPTKRGTVHIGLSSEWRLASRLIPSRLQA